MSYTGQKRRPSPRDVAAAVDAVVARLRQLVDDLAAGEPARCCEALRQLIERIDLRFHRVQRGKRVECPFVSGEITLRQGDGTVFGTVSRGDRI